MAIDHSIPLQTQSFDMLGMLGRGSELAQFYTKQKTDNEMTRIYNESQGDLDKMLSIAPQSKYARWIMPQLQSQKAAQAKVAIDQQQSLADISKTQSEAYKNNQQGGGYALDNSGKKLGAIQGAIQQAAITGDKTQALLALSGLVRTEHMSPEDYEYQSKIINTMTPDELKQYASGIVFSNAKDPSSIMYQTANNVADNETSTNNNIRSTNASIYSTDVSAQTAANKLEQDQQQFEKNYAFNQQKQYFEQNKPLGFQTGNDGYQYAVYANGKGIRVVGEDGQPIKMQPNTDKGGMSATVQKELFETTDALTSGKNAITNLQDALKYSALAYDGLGATQRASARGMIGGGSEEATATAMLHNIVTGNALEMLKATFGAAPTEGERAILLQLQGSANMPRSQREAIYKRALQMAEARVKSNQAKAESIRDGSFFKPQGVQSQQAAQLNPKIMMQMP